jgi:hypothetical protein
MIAFKYLALNSPCIIGLIFGVQGLIPSDLFCNACCGIVFTFYVCSLRIVAIRLVLMKFNNILPYFSIDNAHLMYNAHPKLFLHSF